MRLLPCKALLEYGMMVSVKEIAESLSSTGQNRTEKQPHGTSGESEMKSRSRQAAYPGTERTRRTSPGRMVCSNGTERGSAAYRKRDVRTGM